MSAPAEPHYDSDDRQRRKGVGKKDLKENSTGREGES
jgi:hypothetical protein